MCSQKDLSFQDLDDSSNDVIHPPFSSNSHLAPQAWKSEEMLQGTIVVRIFSVPSLAASQLGSENPENHQGQRKFSVAALV